MKWIPLLLLMCSVARARPAPPPQTIYVTNYVFLTNFVFVTGVVTNVVQVTNTLKTTDYVTNVVNYTNTVNWTNTVNTFSFVTTTNWITNYVNLSVTNTIIPSLPFTNALFYGTTEFLGPGPGLIQTFSGTNVTGHLP